MRALVSGLIGVLALAVPLSGAGAAEACWRADDKTAVRIAGTLAAVAFVHPGNQSRQTAYVIRLAAPACADVTGMDGRVSRVAGIMRVQLAGDLDFARLRALRGKRVAARGTLFPQHTAYHITPVLLLVTAIDAAR